MAFCQGKSNGPLTRSALEERCGGSEDRQRSFGCPKKRRVTGTLLLIENQSGALPCVGGVQDFEQVAPVRGREEMRIVTLGDLDVDEIGRRC